MQHLGRDCSHWNGIAFLNRFPYFGRKKNRSLDFKVWSNLRNSLNISNVSWRSWKIFQRSDPIIQDGKLQGSAGDNFVALCTFLIWFWMIPKCSFSMNSITALPNDGGSLQKIFGCGTWGHGLGMWGWCWLDLVILEIFPNISGFRKIPHRLCVHVPSLDPEFWEFLAKFLGSLENSVWVITADNLEEF